MKHESLEMKKTETAVSGQKVQHRKPQLMQTKRSQFNMQL